MKASALCTIPFGFLSSHRLKSFFAGSVACLGNQIDYLDFSWAPPSAVEKRLTSFKSLSQSIWDSGSIREMVRIFGKGLIVKSGHVSPARQRSPPLRQHHGTGAGDRVASRSIGSSSGD